MKEFYSQLLKTWCDALLGLQINEIKKSGIYGGIICPACSLIHARCADAVYPLMYMAHTTKDERYLDAAVKLQSWSDHVTYPDGSWINEPTSGMMWKGCTVFGAIALGEAIRHHGEILQKNILDRWMDRLRRAAEYIYNHHTMSTGDINYPINCSLVMAIVGEIFNEAKYKTRAREFAHNCLSYFTKENKLLFGEGGPTPQDSLSPQGCRAVDLGYNVEESLPGFALYGLLTGDEEVLNILTESLRNHLEFMLPDGAWDNSWGSRNYKWTYWGSRTTDGCQPAFVLLADRDPSFAEAALRNAKLLKECTHDGILYGGPHYYQHGELPCIYHTLCHTKGLATVLNYAGNKTLVSSNIALPRESSSGIREYPEIRTWLVAIGPWRGTVTAYDWRNTMEITEGHASGGALSMLWHKKVGLVLAASLTKYSRPEPSNMQRQRDPNSMSLTPRIELESDNSYFSSINDLNVTVTKKITNDRIEFSVSGKLADKNQLSPETGEVRFKTGYCFTKDSVEITVSTEPNTHINQTKYTLPVISVNSEEIKYTKNNCIEINKSDGCLKVNTNAPSGFQDYSEQRTFNLIPGFEAIPLIVNLPSRKDNQLSIRISVH